MNIKVINGPNLNLLGTREPEIYGSDSLGDIETRCRMIGLHSGVDIEFLQSNYEGQLVDWIQNAIGSANAIIINAAAYTHTSVAIHDALNCFSGFKLELHISNPHMRESFRHVSHVSTAVDAVIAGFGVEGYEHATRLVIDRLTLDTPT